jgi:hypothetical protein
MIDGLTVKKAFQLCHSSFVGRDSNDLLDYYKKVLIGRTIVPPPAEAHLYSPPALQIKNVSVTTSKKYGGSVMLVETNVPLRKQANRVFDAGFMITDDADGVCNKWTISSARASSVDTYMISKMNNRVSAVDCAGCKKKLVPLFGALLWCPTCEGDKR